MKLPNPEQAIVPEKKLTDYLLSESHVAGRFKAKFFRGLGFNKSNSFILQRELLFLARSQEVINTVQSNFGIKYNVEGNIKTPVGKSVKIRTVWIVEKGKTQPVFITVYPV